MGKGYVHCVRVCVFVGGLGGYESRKRIMREEEDILREVGNGEENEIHVKRKQKCRLTGEEKKPLEGEEVEYRGVGEGND